MSFLTRNYIIILYFSLSKPISRPLLSLLDMRSDTREYDVNRIAILAIKLRQWNIAQFFCNSPELSMLLFILLFTFINFFKIHFPDTTCKEPLSRDVLKKQKWVQNIEIEFTYAIPKLSGILTTSYQYKCLVI